MAYEKQRPDEALRMLKLASETFPQDPFIKLKLAQLANELGEQEYALEMLNKLRSLEWPETYYPQMPQYLADLTGIVQGGEVPTQPQSAEGKTTEVPAKPITLEADQSRQRVMHAK